MGLLSLKMGRSFHLLMSSVPDQPSEAPLNGLLRAQGLRPQHMMSTHNIYVSTENIKQMVSTRFCYHFVTYLYEEDLR